MPQLTAVGTGAGLDEPEIAARLYLSPRTVGSHLHRTFLKLGISDRHQLHELLPATAPADEVTRR